MLIMPEYRLEYFTETARQKFGDVINSAEILRSEISRITRNCPPALVFYGLDDEAQRAIGEQQQEILASEGLKPDSIVLGLNCPPGWDSAQELLRLHEALILYEDFNSPAFDIAYGIYWEKINPGLFINSDNITFYGTGCSFLNRLAAGLTEKPGINWRRVIDHALTELPGDRDILSMESLYSLTGMSAARVLKWLPAFLADDIRYYCSHRIGNIIFTIKGYENVLIDNPPGSEMGDRDCWLRELVAHLPEVMWIILSSVRIPWDEYHPLWKKRLKQYLAGRLCEHDMVRYLISKGIIRKQDQQGILNFSQGIPGHLDMAVTQAYAADMLRLSLTDQHRSQ